MSNAPPLHEGRQPLAGGWTIDLPFPMARRVDEGSLVFWHSPRRLTFWIDIYEVGADVEGEMAHWQAIRSPEASDETIERDGRTVRYAYRLAEDADDDRQPAFYGFVAMPETGQVHLAAYFDRPEQIDEVLAAWRSIACLN